MYYLKTQWLHIPILKNYININLILILINVFSLMIGLNLLARATRIHPRLVLSSH